MKTMGDDVNVTASLRRRIQTDETKRRRRNSSLESGEEMARDSDFNEENYSCCVGARRGQIGLHIVIVSCTHHASTYFRRRL